MDGQKQPRIIQNVCCFCFTLKTAVRIIVTLELLSVLFKIYGVASFDPESPVAKATGHLAWQIIYLLIYLTTSLLLLYGSEKEKVLFVFPWLCRVPLEICYYLYAIIRSIMALSDPSSEVFVYIIVQMLFSISFSIYLAICVYSLTYKIRTGQATDQRQFREAV